MREEPVIYINGRPFVLREEERPFKNMQEYTGIDARRLEQMESRLKADVLREMTGFGGRVLVAHETSGQTGSGIMRGSIVDEFEDTSGLFFKCAAQSGLPAQLLALVPLCWTPACLIKCMFSPCDHGPYHEASSYFPGCMLSCLYRSLPQKGHCSIFPLPFLPTAS